MKIGKQVICLNTQRTAKAYTKFGIPAKAGDRGVITKINELRDVTIVQLQTSDDRNVYCHIQHLAK